jgi:hypothetical protein
VKIVEVWDEVEMRWGHTPGSHLPQPGFGNGEAERAEKRAVGVEEGDEEGEGDEGDEKDEAERRRKDEEWGLTVPEARTGVYDPPL